MENKSLNNGEITYLKAHLSAALKLASVFETGDKRNKHSQTVIPHLDRHVVKFTRCLSSSVCCQSAGKDTVTLNT